MISFNILVAADLKDNTVAFDNTSGGFRGRLVAMLPNRKDFKILNLAL